MKNLLFIFSMLFLMVACDKDDSTTPENGSNNLVKVTVAGAQMIYETDKIALKSKASDDEDEEEEASTFMTVDSQGNSNPIKFITEKGDVLDMEIDKIINLTSEYLVMKGKFIINSEKTVKTILVNKKTELLYVMTDLDFERLVFEDASKNIYFNAEVGDDLTIYKMNVTNPESITLEKYLPNGVTTYSFIINNSGLCFFKASNKYQFKCPGGRIYQLSELISDASNINEASIIRGFNDLFYVVLVDGFYKVESVNNNELKATKSSTLSIDILSEFIPNSLKKTHISSNGNTTTEFNETTGESKVIDLTLPRTYTNYGGFNSGMKNVYITKNCIFIYSDNKLQKLSKSDYTLSEINLAGDYNIESRDIMDSADSQELSFSGFRKSDGKNIIGTIDETGKIEVKSVLTSEPNTLIRLN